MNVLRLMRSAWIFVAIAVDGAHADESRPSPPRIPLVDPAVDELVDGAPAHWPTFDGARRGDGPVSRVTFDKDSGAIALEGDAQTRRWRGVTQRIAVREGTTYRLSFESRAIGLKREADQFNSAYVGVKLFGPPQRSATNLRFVEPRGETWCAEEIVFRAEGERAEVVAFLSKSGRLEFRKPVLEELRPSDSFDVLVRHMTKYYAHFDSAIADWSKLVAEHGKSFVSDAGPVAFSEAAKEFLKPLKDPHVWIVPSPGATMVVPYASEVKPNGDLAIVRAAVTNGRQLGRVAGLGEIGTDVGYLLISSMQGTDEEFAQIDRALDAWRDAGRSILIDLRWNAGGDERRGLPIAARFADAERVYARRRVRACGGLEDLSAPSDARVVPAKDANATTPVVVLVGPFCMSSGEGMALMFHALPQVKLVGQPTRGASGNPAPVALPNGVEVWFSRWVTFLPDGTPLEGRGVPPDVVVEHAGSDDPTFVRGLAVLRAMKPPK